MLPAITIRQRCCLAVIVLCSCVVNIKAFHHNFPGGARAQALGGCYVTLGGFRAVYNNPAGMTKSKNIAAGFYYENRFLIRKLSLKSCAVTCPAGSGVVGMTYSYFGYHQYHETKTGLAYAMELSEHLSAGVMLDYLTTYVAEDYGSKGLVTCEAGMVAELSEDLQAAVHIFNPAGVTYSSCHTARVATLFTFGLSYRPAEKLMLCSEVSKTSRVKPAFKAGAEYRVTEPLYLRAGIMTHPVQNTFGFGLYFKRIKADFSSSVHQTLGYSPQISFMYEFN